MRRTALVFLAAIAALVLASPVSAAPGRPGGLVALTEQASRRILVLPADQEAWRTRAYTWSWAPAAANGLGDLAAAFVSPDEAKLTERAGQQYLMTTASGGFAGVIPYPQGTGAYWAANVGGPSNPHSIELLPDGNVAVAASTGGWLRVYTASQGARSTTYAEYPLVGGHGVVWDHERQVLWALGTHELVALRVGGTPAAPVLTAEQVFHLPSEGGHDLQPVPGSGDQLWVTTETEVLRFSKSRGTFSTRYPGAAAINGHNVKSVTTNARTGQVLTATPQADHICTWCTDTVDLDLPRGELTLRGAWIYKARWWQPQH
ncbi:DUF6528 family protein [Amycolatopsis albispora]|uniref:SMP-30/Gluconolactonase/LRE-like region domain-containing protein n=1 Tax=Amycolatopsis albispora TaxID=1804986 RepID=A0A344L9L8_9PSEU|nr:DUF6528 family protein [Amycolatopsis albispora]AXB44742.1 hypothetical protein A4R43_21400 [Amycolatopsis albispora]